MGRQTTPPERAGGPPAYKTKKQHNFLTGLRKENAATPAPQKPDAVLVESGVTNEGSKTAYAEG